MVVYFESRAIDRIPRSKMEVGGSIRRPPVRGLRLDKRTIIDVPPTCNTSTIRQAHGPLLCGLL